MPQSLAGIHHVTAIAGDPQANVDFYAGALGLRLVKSISTILPRTTCTTVTTSAGRERC
jgi:catechol 2,3-dioxygenase-like lactoylglutathione lyase family enzyme